MLRQRVLAVSTRRRQGPFHEHINPHVIRHFTAMNKLLAALIASVFAVGAFAADAPAAAPEAGASAPAKMHKKMAHKKMAHKKAAAPAAAASN